MRVALTGGIGTGKSYCLARFAHLGAPVTSADALARDAVAPGSRALAAIVQRFGAGILAPDGTLDRNALARIVFHDAHARRDLESIVHPIVYARVRDWFTTLPVAGPDAAAPADVGIADIPLLYETGHEVDFDRVVVAACAPATQLARVAARGGIGAGEANARIAAQWPIDAKRARADYVIDTDGSFADTDRQVEEVWNALRHEPRPA
ncbi:MAG: dephospho-CoA kinase [Acidobacteria bacterium]|nr:dephospho-CoA kinase [Acidobacteriota bacterium]